MKKKRLLALFTVTAIVTSLLPVNSFANETMSKFMGYRDGVYQGVGYGKTNDEMTTSVTVKNGKIVDVSLEHFSDDSKLQPRLEKDFFKSLKKYGPEYVARMLWEMTEYWEFIALEGTNNVNLSDDGTVSGYVEVKIPENLAGVFNTSILNMMIQV